MTERPPHPTPKKQRGRAGSLSPRRSDRPWAGFTAHDSPRPEPLPSCPAARCRRAKACLAALDNLYCLRTHHGLRELVALARQTPLARLLAAVPEVGDPDNLSERMERVAELAQIRRDHEAEMLALWKSGGLDHLYGPYRRHGVVLHPPQRGYVEARLRGKR